MDANADLGYLERGARATNPLSESHASYNQGGYPIPDDTPNANRMQLKLQIPTQGSLYSPRGYGTDGAYAFPDSQQVCAPKLGLSGSLVTGSGYASYTQGGYGASQSGFMEYGRGAMEGREGQVDDSDPVQYHDDCGMPIRPQGYEPAAYYCLCRDGTADACSREADTDISKLSGASKSGADAESELDDSAGNDETGSNEESAVAVETEVDNASSIKDTVLPKIGEFKGRFASTEEAEYFIQKVRHQVEVDMDDFGAVKDELQSWANKIFDAMRTMPADARDKNVNMFNTISKKGFKAPYFEARAYDVVARVIDLHETGSELLAKFQLKNSTIEQCKASERLNRLIHVCLYNKGVVKDILDGWKVSAIVAEPSARMKCANDTVQNNKRKKEVTAKLKADNARMKAELARGSGRSASVGQGGSKGKPVGKKVAKRGKKLVAEQTSDSDGSDDEQVQAEIGNETSQSAESNSELSAEDEIVDKKSTIPQGTKSASKKVASVPQRRTTRGSLGKNSTKVSDTDGTLGPAASPGGGKRKRVASGKNVQFDGGDPPSEGRKLRPRHQ